MKKSNWIKNLQIALLLLFAVSSVAFASENLTANFIDVGQGDSILLQFDGKNVLIDGGIQEMGPTVETYLRNHGVSSLDLLVATHPHEDHIGGLITILNDFPVKQVLDSGQPHSSQVYETFLTLIDQKNISYNVAQRGQKINLDTNLKIDVLSPPPTLFSDDLNQNSIVLKVAYNKVSFLLMGDAGFEAENSIKSAGYDLKSDILKVGHHGSSSASGKSFLTKVKPSICIIEAGAGNGYGHPTQKTLSALERIGSKIYRTDTNGNIAITTDGTSYSISTQKLSAVPASTTSQTKTSAYTPTVTQASSPITAPSNTVSGGPFVGSAKSDKYHYPSCSAAKRIKSANLVTFSNSADARAQGYGAMWDMPPFLNISGSKPSKMFMDLLIKRLFEGIFEG